MAPVKALFAALVAWITRACSAWQTFWFKPSAPHTLGLIRLLAGGMIFYTHVVWTIGLDAFFSPNGWHSRRLMTVFQEDRIAPSFWWLIPEPWMMTTHVICLVILFLFWIGFATTVTSILTLIITISYAYRAQLSDFGLDQVNGFLALYLTIGPSGYAYSVDQWLRDRRARKWSSEKPATPVFARATLATRLIQVQLCVIYFFAGTGKLLGPAWWDGTAIWKGVANLEYQSQNLTWMAWYPWMSDLLTHVTVCWEITFWTFVWKRDLRPLVLAIGVSMHLGIGAFLGMWTFGLAMIIAYFSFMPPETTAFLVQLVTFRREKTSARIPAKKVKRAIAAPRPESSFEEPAFTTSEPAGRDDTYTASGPVWTKTSQATASDVRRPVILIVEPRIQSQAALEEYLTRHGFDCYVADDLPAARSRLASVDLDAVFLDASWLKIQQIDEFRETLILARGPASLTMVTNEQRTEHRISQTQVHKVIIAPPRLREVRETLVSILKLNLELQSEYRLTHPAEELMGKNRAPVEWSESLL